MFIIVLIIPLLSMSLALFAVSDFYFKVISIAAVLFTFWAIYKFPKYFARGVLQVSFLSGIFRINYLEPYFGHKKKSEIQFSLDDIKSYKYEPSFNFSTLKIKLHSGKKIAIHRFFFDDEDDYGKFFTHFNRTVINYNKKKSTVTPIKEESLIMDHPKSFWTEILLYLLMFCAILLVVYFIGKKRPIGIIAFSTLILILVWLKIKNNSTWKN